ncbi:opticin [Rhinolophus ferrumequinum]|uniref:opticin n=1 Tax=Rhinolophus ferrumequinum TaxID=59479 RepID=UPI00140FF8DA|nr:opticin [Rhinolophus ferrumequinum]
MNFPASLSLLALVLQEAGPAFCPKKKKKRSKEQLHREGGSNAVLRLGNYSLNMDNYNEVIDLSNCEELTDCGDQVPEVKGTSLAPPNRISSTESTMALRTPSSNPTVTRPTMWGLLASLTSHSLPTCLVRVYLGSSVYCDNADLKRMPCLPQTTAYLYACSSCREKMECPVSLCSPSHHSVKLKRTDLFRNFISSVDNYALHVLPALQDLILPGNQLTAPPRLRMGIEVLAVHLDELQSSGIQAGAFRPAVLVTKV